MGADCAADAREETAGQTTTYGFAPGHGGDPLCRYDRSREQDGRDATPPVGIIDSQSVKTAENGGPRGYDAGQKIRGRKRHITTNTPGHVVAAVVHPANIQDRDGAPLVAVRIRSLFPWLRHLIGDGGYAGEKLRGALAEPG